MPMMDGTIQIYKGLKMKELNVQFSKKQRKSLDRLAKELHVTKSKVLSMSLSLLEVVIRENRVGNHIGIVKDHIEIKEIVGIFPPTQ